MAAISTAAMIGLGVAAGSQVAGGIMQGKAADKAAKQQMAGADKAAAMRSTIYGNQMRGMEPYARFGEQNINTLGRLMNPGVPYTPDQQARDASAFQNRPPQSWIDPFSGQGGPAGGAQPASRPAPPGGGMPASTGGGGGPVPWMPFAGSPGTQNRMLPRPPMQGGAPPMAPPNMEDYRARGIAAGQDMSWMDKPGALTLPNMSATGGISPQMQEIMARRRPTSIGGLYGRGFGAV